MAKITRQFEEEAAECMEHVIFEGVAPVEHDSEQIFKHFW